MATYDDLFYSPDANIFLSNDWDLTSFDQVKEGVRWVWPHLYEMEENRQLQQGNLKVLFDFSSEDLFNGLSVIKNIDNIVQLNYFMGLTNFYVNAMYAERPVVQSETPERQNFIENIEETLFIRLEEAEKYRSMNGRTVIVVENGVLESIDPRWYFPVRNLQDREVVEAHLLAYTYYDPSVMDNDTPIESLGFQPINRIKLIFYDPVNNINRYEIRQMMGGITIGPIIDYGNANIQGLWTYEDNMGGDYRAIKNPLKKMMVRLSMMDGALNVNSFPHLELDSQVAEQYQYEKLGNIFPRNMNSAEARYIEYSPSFEAVFAFNDEMWEYIQSATGISKSSFGLTSASNNESGKALAELSSAAIAKVRRLRKDVELWIPEILDALGAPTGDTDVIWTTDPLQSKTHKQEELFQLFDRGIIDEKTIKNMIGMNDKKYTNALAKVFNKVKTKLRGE